MAQFLHSFKWIVRKLAETVPFQKMKLGEITVFYVVQEGLELVVKKVSKKIFQKKEKSSNVGKITNMIR